METVKVEISSVIMFNTNNILKRQQPIDEMQYLSVYSTPLSWVANYPMLKTHKKNIQRCCSCTFPSVNDMLTLHALHRRVAKIRLHHLFLKHANSLLKSVTCLMWSLIMLSFLLMWSNGQIVRFYYLLWVWFTIVIIFFL